MPLIDADEVDLIEAAFTRFAEGFRRSKRGNIWCEWDGLTLTVFPRSQGFCWCIADSEGPQFSRRRYETEGEAMESLWSELGGWQ